MPPEAVPAEAPKTAAQPEAAKAPPAPAAKSAPADDDTPLPPLDHDAEVSAQIKQAEENLKREERRKAKGEKGKPKAPQKSAPAKDEAKAEPEKPEAKAEPEEQPKPKKSPRELFEAGDLDGAIEAAFGVKPDALRINSARWAEWRKANTEAKRELAAERSKLDGEKQQFQGLVKQVREQVAPLLQARKLFESGKIGEAVKHAFGVDFDDFNKRGLREYHKSAASDPRVDALENELKQLRAEKAEAERRKQEEAEKASSAEIEQKNMTFIRGELERLAEDDPSLAKLAGKPRAVARVLQILQEHYDERTKTTLPVRAAAEMVRDWIAEEFGDLFDASRDRSESESPHRAGTKPERPATATLSTRGATEASTPGRALTDEEMFAKYSRLAKAG